MHHIQKTSVFFTLVLLMDITDYNCQFILLKIKALHTH